MLTHQVPMLSKYTRDHRNSLSLLFNLHPRLIPPVPPTLPTQWNPKPEAISCHTQTPWPRTALACHCRLQRTREGERNTTCVCRQTQHHGLSLRNTLETIQSRGHQCQGEGNWSMFMVKGPHEEESSMSDWASRWGGGDLLTVS